MSKTLVARKFEEMDSEALPPEITDGTPLRRPLRVGILSNPLSGQNLRRGLHMRIQDVLQSHPGVVHLDAQTSDRIQAAARELVEDDAEIIAVNGGDGTVQAVLTAVLGAPMERLPVLVVLAGGTTNATASNVGFGKRPLAAVQRLLAAAARGFLPGKVEARAVMRVDLANDTQYAMMFGAGAVYHGILFARRHIESRGVRGEIGGGLAVAAFVGKILSGSGGTLFPPVHAEVLIDGSTVAKQAYLGILTSTMTRQILGIRPYWGSGPGPLRFTALRCQPKHLWRALVPVLRGKADVCLRPEFGYHSVNADEVSLRFDSGFTLDGELFPPADGQTKVTLSARQCAYFLRDR